jgi:hypothetical protein
MSKSDVSKIASIKNITESEARKICVQVQKCFKVGFPPYKVIAKTVQMFPDATVKDIALCIDSDLIYGVKAELSTRRKQNDHPSWLSDKKLIKSVANLLPDEDRGSEEMAKQILIDLARIKPNAVRLLTSEQVVEVLKRVKRSGNWNFRQLMLETRKEAYGYLGDPDHPWIKVISTPMGGKPR